MTRASRQTNCWREGVALLSLALVVGFGMGPYRIWRLQQKCSSTTLDLWPSARSWSTSLSELRALTCLLVPSRVRCTLAPGHPMRCRQLSSGGGRVGLPRLL